MCYELGGSDTTQVIALFLDKSLDIRALAATCRNARDAIAESFAELQYTKSPIRLMLYTLRKRTCDLCDDVCFDTDISNVHWDDCKLCDQCESIVVAHHDKYCGRF